MASCDAPQRRQARLPPSLKTNGDVCMVLRLERKDQMSRSGAVGTYLRCSEGYSNCEGQEHPCSQYTVLVPIPPGDP